MRKPTFQTKRQKKRTALRKIYGNPWDSSSSSTSKRKVTFREPLTRSASKSKSSSNVWRTVSSKKNTSK